MRDIGIAVSPGHIWNAARANTWKTGRLSETDQYSEMQMSDDAMEMKMAAQLITEGFYMLKELVKDFRGSHALYSRNLDNNEESEGDILPGNRSDMMDMMEDPDSPLELQLYDVSERNNVEAEELNVLAQDFVLDYVMESWYKLVDPSRQASWAAKRADAAERILRALRYKTKLD